MEKIYVYFYPLLLSRLEKILTSKQWQIQGVILHFSKSCWMLMAGLGNDSSSLSPSEASELCAT